MTRFIALLGIIFCIVTSAHAQDNLVGRIHEDKSNVAVPGINVRNLKTNKVVASDATGAFSIPAKVGDIVVFSGFSYRSDTLYVQKLGYIDIVLTLNSKMLDEVKVTGQETKLGSLKGTPTLSPFKSDKVVYTRDNAGNYIGGLTMRLPDSHSAENKRKKEAQVQKDEGIKSKIADVFSAEGLKNYLDLKGQEMKNYIIMYTPDIPTYTSPSFNIVFYVDSCYKEFRKIPADKRASKELTELNPLH
ncbi:MAG: hypothetical protein ACHQHN_04070 [Sphingobacteriales bacterium]